MDLSTPGIGKPEYLVQSGNYARTMEETVLPFLKQRERVTRLTVSGTSLYCVSWQADNPVGTVVIVHGFTENAFKYSELAFSLLHHRFSVLAYDQRGHGRSGRAEGIRNASVTHVDRFDDYVDDLKAVTDRFLPELPRPYFLFAHSMGGAVSALFLERFQDVFSAAVFSAPMIAPNTGIPALPASAFVAVGTRIGRRLSHPFFMKPYSGPESFADSCATDRNRFDWYDRIKAENECFQNSVPSYGWIRESIAVTKKILQDGAVEKIACPVFLFSAETDSSVQRQPQLDFIARVPRGKQELIRGSRHEIFRSTDDVLYPWWNEVLVFYREMIQPDSEARK